MVSLQDSKVEWLGKIPKHWFVAKLKNQCQIIPSNVDKKSHDNETEVRLCNYVDVYYNESIDDSIEYMVATANEHELKKFQLFEGDVLITKDSEDPHDIAVPALVVKTQPKLLFGYLLSIIRSTKTNCSGPYIFWALRDASIASQLHREATGITRWAIANKHVKNSMIPLPPEPEQHRIASYLGKTCAAIDKAIEAKQKQLEILDALRKSIIHKAVTRGLDDSVELRDSRVEWLGRIPKHWLTTQLKLVSTLQSGITLGKIYGGKLIERPYLRVANVQDGFLELEKIKTIFLPASEAKHTELCRGDVLMTEGGDLDKLGRGHMWDGQIPNCLHQNHIFAIRCNNAKLLPEYLTFMTSSGYGRAYFEATGKRTTNLASTNATKIRSFQIPLPPRAEQTAIIEDLTKMQKQSGKLQVNLYTQISTLKQYRKSLIHECVTGKRRITENDMQGQL